MTSPILPYASPSTQRPVRRIWRVFGCVLAAAVIALGIAAIYVSNQPSGANRETANMVRCSFKLREIGQCFAQYAAANSGSLPDSISSLVRATPSFQTRWLVCESDSADVAPSVDVLLKSLADPDPRVRRRYCSYVYVGDSLTLGQLDRDIILMCEPLENHEDWSVVLLGDFSSDLFPARGLRPRPPLPMDHAYSQIGKGVRPVRLTTTAPSNP